VRIADHESGAVLADGARGEIQLKGWCVFDGYYKDAERTADVFTPDGWLRTGDIGALENERIIYLGRFKDMLKIGGENVAAPEIESFLMTHPAVLLAQVIGVPDDQLVEVAAAFVALKPGATITGEDLVRHCAGNIASYKIPRYVRFVSEWPQSATKIQKFRLANDFRPTDRLDVRALVAAARSAENT
jgi:fatty-acyl-CoA synthase